MSDYPLLDRLRAMHNTDATNAAIEIERLTKSLSEAVTSDAALTARVGELEGALRLNLAVAPDDPILLTSNEAEIVALREKNRDQRCALMEIRARLHCEGRRPEECYEMSMIDAALNKGE